MRVFVTGGGGFIGGHLVDHLLNKRAEVTVLDTYEDIPTSLIHHKDNEKFQYVSGDIRNKEFLEETISDDYDKIFHLAAIVGVENYCKTPLKTLDVNIGGTRNIADIALSKDIKVIFSSTSEIFGKNPNVPWSETSDRVLGPTHVDRWSYSTSKSTCEHMLFAVHKQFGLPIVIVRYFNVYGPRQMPIFVIPAMIEKILHGESPIVYDNGEMTRCFTFVEDVIEGTIKASEVSNAVGESFNLGNTHETKIKDLVKMIIEKAGESGEIEPTFIDTKKLYDSYEDLQRRIPDTSKAGRILGWKATTDLEDGLVKTIEWYKKVHQKSDDLKVRQGM